MYRMHKVTKNNPFSPFFDKKNVNLHRKTIAHTPNKTIYTNSLRNNTPYPRHVFQRNNHSTCNFRNHRFLASHSDKSGIPLGHTSLDSLSAHRPGVYNGGAFYSKHHTLGSVRRLRSLRTVGHRRTFQTETPCGKRMVPNEPTS